MTLSTTKAAVAGLAFLALSSSFSAQAEAPHPLLDTSTGATAYRGRLIKAVDAAVGAEVGEYLGGGIVATLEETLRGPIAHRTDTVVYESKSGYSAVIQVLNDPEAPVYVCVEKDNEIWGSWKILNNAQVVSDETPSRPVKGVSVCESWTMATALHNPVAKVATQQPLPAKK